MYTRWTWDCMQGVLNLRFCMELVSPTKVVIWDPCPFGFTRNAGRSSNHLVVQDIDFLYELGVGVLGFWRPSGNHYGSCVRISWGPVSHGMVLQLTQQTRKLPDTQNFQKPLMKECTLKPESEPLHGKLKSTWILYQGSSNTHNIAPIIWLIA